MVRFLKWFVPGRNDYLCVLYFLLFLTLFTAVLGVGFWLTDRDFDYRYFAVPYLALLGLVASTAALVPWRNNWRFWSFGMLAFLSIASIPSLLKLTGVWDHQSWLLNHNREFQFSWETVGYLYLGVLAIFLVTLVFDWGIAGIGNRVTRLKVDRVKILIAVAVVLFVFNFARNLMSGSRVPFFLNQAGSGWTVVILGGVAAVLALVSLPTLLLMRVRSAWLAPVLCGVLFAVAYFVVMGLPYDFTYNVRAVTVPIYFVSFLIIGFSMRLVFAHFGSLNERDSVAGWERKFAGPLGGLFAVATLVLIGAFFYWDAHTLIGWRGPGRFTAAREVRQVQFKPGVLAFAQIDFSGRRGASMGMAVQLDEHAPADTFNSLSFSAFQPNWMHIEGINPQIELGWLKRLAPATNKFSYLSILHGRMSPDQLVEFSNAASNHLSLTDIDLVVDGEAADGSSMQVSFFQPSPLQVGFQELEPGQLQTMIRCFGKQLSSIYVHNSELSVEDWKAAVDLSRSCLVRTWAWENPGLPSEVLDYLAKVSEQGPLNLELPISLDETDDIGENVWRLLLDTDAKGQIYRSRGFEAQTFWDAVFGSRATTIYGQDIKNRCLDFIGAPDVRSTCHQRHWLFRSGDSETENAILVPGATDESLEQICELGGFELLALDTDWLPALDQSTLRARPEDLYSELQDLSPIGGLKDLKQLYLGLGIDGADLGFLKQLTELEHLQFNCSSRNLNFANCNNLTSVEIVAGDSVTPAADLGRALRAVAGIPSLERLVIHDVMYQFELPADQDQLRKKFGNVEVEFVTPLSPDEKVNPVPASFKEHVQRVRQQLREKYLK